MNNYYKLYIEDIYSLAETIVIKFEDAADAINLKVMTDYGIDSVSQNPLTWKYYQNISGEYHFSDCKTNGQKIIIKSLDTKEDIEFTKESLRNNPATNRAYFFGKRHYLELIQKYPQHIQLILGILYPCDIDKAIAAKDGTILSYPSYLVESNEYTFISKIQTWIYKYIDRWINKQFTISDDLYVAMYMSQLYLHLVPVIINTRLQACKTNEAHSFHVREYLSSHELLDQYMPAMTKSQSLFFYRNILYIERHSGKRDTFDWLLDNVMTVRNLPVYEYIMKHNVSNMLASGLNNDTTSYYPEIFFKKKSVNYSDYNVSNTFIPLDDVNYKLKFTYPGNEEYLFQNKTNILNKLQDSISNVVGTKLLESSVTDYTDMVPYTLESILINHWLYWGATGNYNAYISVITNIAKDTIELKVIDAFILMIYALNKSIGYTLKTVPDLLATRVLQQNKVPLSKLKKIIDPKYVTDNELLEIHNSTPGTYAVNTVDSFYLLCNEIYQSTIIQDKIQAQTEHYLTRGYLQAAVSSMYMDIKLNVNRESVLYDTWLTNIGLDFTGYTDINFADLAISITNDATGILNKAPVSIKAVQKAMIEIFQMLSSYSIQFVSNVNEPAVLLVPNPSVRLGDILESDKDNKYIDVSQPDVVAVTTKENEKEYLDQNTVFPLGEIAGKEASDITNIPIDIDILLKNNVHEVDSDKLHLPNITVLKVTDVILESKAFVNGNFNLPIRLYSDQVISLFKTFKSKLFNLPVKVFVDTINFRVSSGKLFNLPVKVFVDTINFRVSSGKLFNLPVKVSGNPDTATSVLNGNIQNINLILAGSQNLYETTTGKLTNLPITLIGNPELYETTTGKLTNLPINLTGNPELYETTTGNTNNLPITLSGNYVSALVDITGTGTQLPLSVISDNINFSVSNGTLTQLPILLLNNVDASFTVLSGILQTTPVTLTGNSDVSVIDISGISTQPNILLQGDQAKEISDALGVETIIPVTLIGNQDNSAVNIESVLTLAPITLTGNPDLYETTTGKLTTVPLNLIGNLELYETTIGKLTDISINLIGNQDTSTVTIDGTQTDTPITLTGNQDTDTFVTSGTQINLDILLSGNADTSVATFNGAHTDLLFDLSGNVGLITVDIPGKNSLIPLSLKGNKNLFVTTKGTLNTIGIKLYNNSELYETTSGTNSTLPISLFSDPVLYKTVNGKIMTMNIKLTGN